MDCKSIQNNCEAYLDSELTLSDRRDFEEHVHDCKDCKAVLESMQALGIAIQEAGYVQAPYSLRRKINTGLKDISGEDDRKYSKYHLLGYGLGSAALAAVAVWTVTIFIFATPMQTQLSDELIAAHVRSLMVDHVVDIVTADSHVIKPWFNGKLDYSPIVKDFKDNGFPLVGGRLDYVQNKQVAAVVYKRRSHYINLFIYRQDADTAKGQYNTLKKQGFNLVNWDKDGLKYWAVSDLNTDELKQFTYMFNQSASGDETL